MPKDKLTAVRIKQPNGSYSDEIPISAKTDDVLYKNTQYNLNEILGNVNVLKGSIQEQIDGIQTTAIGQAVADWMDENATAATSVVLDKSLTIENEAADAKAAGKIITINDEPNVASTKMHLDTSNDTVSLALTEDIPDMTNFVAQAFSSTNTYKINDYVIYNNTLWKCIVDIIPADEQWVPQHWINVEIGSKITVLENVLDNLAWVRQQIPFSTQPTFYINTNASINTIINISNRSVASNTMTNVVVQCKKGDKFIIKGQGGIDAKLWAFTDTDYKLLSRSASSLNVDGLELTAPEDGYLIQNSKVAQNPYCYHLYYFENVGNKINKLTNDIDNKQDILTFDNNPIKNSNNPVTSDGIYNQLNHIYNVVSINQEEKIGNIVDCNDCMENAQLNKYILTLPYNVSGYTNVEIRRTGKNLWGGNAILQDWQKYIPSATINQTDRTFYFSHGASVNENKYFVNYKPATSYKIILKYRKSSMASTDSGQDPLNIRVCYVTGNSGTDGIIYGAASAEIQQVQFDSTSSKTIDYIGKSDRSSKNTYLYVDECGVFEKSLYSGFEEYKGQSYICDWEDDIGTIYGGTYDVLNGILTQTYDSSGNEIMPIQHEVAKLHIQQLEGYNTIWCTIQDSISTIIFRTNIQTLANSVKNKQDTLIFDNQPTENSNNSVTSGSVYSYVSSLMSAFGGDVQAAVEAYFADQPPVNIPDASLTSTKMAIEMKEWIRRSIINVKDYGAVGDGITDDSEAIKLAIAAIPKSYGVLYFPPGLYILGDGIEDDLGGVFPATYTGSYAHTGNGYLYSGSKNKDSLEDNPDNILSEHLIIKYLENSNGSNNGFYPDKTGVQKNYINMGRDIVLNFDQYDHLIIFGHSAELRSNDNNGDCINNAIFEFSNCSNLVIKNLIINGRRQQRGAWLTDSANYNRRGNLGIRGCQNVLIDNVESINSMMDGLVVANISSTFSEYITISNCKFLSNHRQGISIVGARHVTIDKCIINQNGTNGDTRIIENGHTISGHLYQGSNPKDGIDIEANSNNEKMQNQKICIKNSFFEKNAGRAIQCPLKCKDLIIDSCIVKDTNISISSKAIRNIKILNNSIYSPARMTISASSGLVKNNIFYYNYDEEMENDNIIQKGLVNNQKYNVLSITNPGVYYSNIDIDKFTNPKNINVPTQQNPNPEPLYSDPPNNGIIPIVQATKIKTVPGLGDYEYASNWINFYQDILLVDSNEIICAPYLLTYDSNRVLNVSESVGLRNVFCNVGIYVNNPAAIIQNNIIMNPIWGINSDSPIQLYSYLINKDNVIYQRYIPQGTQEINESLSKRYNLILPGIVIKEYQTTNTCAINDYCINNYIIYRCKENITGSAGTFDSSKWQSVTYNSNQTYAINDYCIYNNKLYRCTSTIALGEIFNNQHWEEIKQLTVNNNIWIYGEIIPSTVIDDENEEDDIPGGE